MARPGATRLKYTAVAVSIQRSCLFNYGYVKQVWARDCGLRPSEIGKSISPQYDHSDLRGRRGKDFGLKIEDFRSQIVAFLNLHEASRTG